MENILHIWKIVHTFAMQFGRMDCKGNKSAYIEMAFIIVKYVRYYLLLCSASPLLDYVLWCGGCCWICPYRTANSRCEDNVQQERRKQGN